jgi:hypothetical protein
VPRGAAKAGSKKSSNPTSSPPAVPPVDLVPRGEVGGYVPHHSALIEYPTENSELLTGAATWQRRTRRPVRHDQVDSSRHRIKIKSKDDMRQPRNAVT